MSGRSRNRPCSVQSMLSRTLGCRHGMSLTLSSKAAGVSGKFCTTNKSRCDGLSTVKGGGMLHGAPPRDELRTCTTSESVPLLAQWLFSVLS